MARLVLDDNVRHVPTEEQIREIEEASKRPIVFDEDCPELPSVEEMKLRIIEKGNRKLEKFKVMVSVVRKRSKEMSVKELADLLNTEEAVIIDILSLIKEKPEESDRQIAEELFWKVKERENWNMKMNVPLTLIKITEEEYKRLKAEGKLN